VLTNTKPVPASLKGVDVLDADDGSKVLALEGEDLTDNLRTLDVQPVEDGSLPPNESRLLYITAAFDPEDAVPDALDHRIEVKGADNPGATKPSPLRYKAGRLTLSEDSPTVLSPPLAGRGWIAINGCCGLGHPHRESVQSVNGKLYNSQRFAVDFMRLDSDGRLVEGDTTKNQNFAGYGAPVMAAGDGVVVSTLDEMEDNEPGALPDPSLFTELGIASVDGNHVVIDHGNGLYSFYAHLQKGSIEVKVGNRVQAGGELGLLGNTGNSSAPHLHFHITNGPSPLGAQGVPYVFDSFQLAGVADPTDDEFDKALFEGAATFPGRAKLDPVERRDEMPLDNAITDFPSE
jgi:murein DD-endopeptidase MepM/ murein hydrolase activator NlpD